MPPGIVEAAPDTGLLLHAWIGASSRLDVAEAVWESLPGVSQERVRYGVGAGRWSTVEGRTFGVTLGLGTLAVECFDANRRERTVERSRQARTKLVDVLGVYVDAETGEVAPPEQLPSRSITEWSSKSRNRLRRTMADVDWSELEVPGSPLGMVTLTLPGSWEVLTPNGRVFKRFVHALRQRFYRAVGRPMDGAWKLEFQHRGAPHLHALIAVPPMVDGETFERWLSRTWASIVGSSTACDYCGGDTMTAGCTCGLGTSERRRHIAAGTGVDFAAVGDFTDPRRIAAYFLGHSAKTTNGKEYQHIVPELWQAPGAGPGRFWGLWGVKPTRRRIEIDQAEYVRLLRIMRKHRHAPRTVVTVRNGVVGYTLGPRRPKVRGLGAAGGFAGGWTLLNDAPALATRLALFLSGLRPDPAAGASGLSSVPHLSAAALPGASRPGPGTPVGPDPHDSGPPGGPAGAG